MRRQGSVLRFIFGMILLALTLAVILGPSIYLELAGAGASGTIVARREVIDVSYGTWTRRLFLDVSFRPRDTEEVEVAEIAVWAETYDQARVEEPVRMRYLLNPTLRQLGATAAARLESQRPLEPLVARVGMQLIVLLIGLGVWLLVLLAWSKWRRWWLALVLLAMMVVAALTLGMSWPTPAPPGPLVPGTATVRATHEITQIGSSRRRRGISASQPYTIVELAHAPAGMAGPVVAVDVIDSGSRAGLEQGDAVPIRYSAADPRWAAIEGATRTYYWKNVLGWGLRALPYVGLLLLILLVSVWWTRRKQRRSPP